MSSKLKKRRTGIDSVDIYPSPPRLVSHVWSPVVTVHAQLRNCASTAAEIQRKVDGSPSRRPGHPKQPYLSGFWTGSDPKNLLWV